MKRFDLDEMRAGVEAQAEKIIASAESNGVPQEMIEAYRATVPVKVAYMKMIAEMLNQDKRPFDIGYGTHQLLCGIMASCYATLNGADPEIAEFFYKTVVSSAMGMKNADDGEYATSTQFNGHELN